MLIRTDTMEPVTMDQLRAENPRTWFPLEPTDADLAGFGIARVRPTPIPPHDPTCERCAETAPRLGPDGVWLQSWEIIPNDPGPERDWHVA